MESLMTIDSRIFKAYDIRGVYGEELNEETAYLIGKAVVTYLKVKKILVGRDMRTSSIPLRDALVRGIREQGADVVDIGLCSTSMFYWATQKYKAGVMVTASHNPAQYNGFKICKNGAFPVGESTGMKNIAELVIDGEFPSVRRKGTYEEISVLDEFISFNLSFLKTNKRFKVVIDAANGMGGYVYGALMKRLPSNITIVPLYFEPDGTFPNHEANPLKLETLKDLQKRVIKKKADLGVALDGDEDRVAFVDNKGEPISGDFTTCLIAEQVLLEHPKGTILYDIRQSRITPETISAAGGIPIMTKVGHALIKVAMHEHHGTWGGEGSGHFYNSEQQNSENTQIIFFRLLNLIAEKNKPLSVLVQPLKKYAKLEETNFTVKNAKEIIVKMEQQYKKEASSVSHLDGIRVEFADWWFNLRMSNTEPLLRLNMEAKNERMLKAKFKELQKNIMQLSK